MYIGNTRQMYPSQFCRQALRHIGFLQFAQLKEVSSFSCNQFVVQSLSILLFPNIRGPSTSRKKIGHFRQLFFIEIEKRKSPKYLIQLNVDDMNKTKFYSSLCLVRYRK